MSRKEEKAGMKFQWKRFVVLSLAAAFLGANLIAMAEESAESRRISILSVSGEEAYVIRGGSREVKAVGGMPLGQGSQVRTGLETTAYLEADDDKVIKLDSSTIVDISKASSKKLKITLKSGELFFNVKKPLAEDEELRFDAAQTSMSVRGTSGLLKKTENSLEAYLVEGTVQWNIGNQTVELSKGQKANLKRVSGEALEGNGMNSAYELDSVEAFDWQDLDAMGLEAVLEQGDSLDLSAIGLDSAGQIEEARSQAGQLREEQNRIQQEQRQQAESWREEAAQNAAQSGSGGEQRAAQEPEIQEDSDDDDDYVAWTQAVSEPVSEPTSEPAGFQLPADAEPGVNGERLYVIGSGNETWYYYEELERFGGATFNNTSKKWEVYTNALNAAGLSLTPTP